MRRFQRTRCAGRAAGRADTLFAKLEEHAFAFHVVARHVERGWQTRRALAVYPDRRDYKLESLSGAFYPDLIDYKQEVDRKNMGREKPEVVAEYACKDADATFRLAMR